jgi:hypothetical protein
LAGRKDVFRDYRLRVAAVVRDYGMSERRDQAPADSRAIAQRAKRDVKHCRLGGGYKIAKLHGFLAA